MAKPNPFAKKDDAAPADDTGDTKAPPFTKEDDKPPADDKKPDKSASAEAAGMKKQAEDLVSEAKQGGALKPLEDLVMDLGLDQTAEELLLLSQKDDQTRGKSPTELAKMYREDGGLLDTVLEGADTGSGDAQAPDDTGESGATGDTSDESVGMDDTGTNDTGVSSADDTFGGELNSDDTSGAGATTPTDDSNSVDDYASGQTGSMKGIDPAVVRKAIKSMPELEGMSFKEALAAIEDDPHLKARLLKMTAPADDGQEDDNAA